MAARNPALFTLSIVVERLNAGDAVTTFVDASWSFWLAFVGARIIEEGIFALRTIFAGLIFVLGVFLAVGILGRTLSVSKVVSVLANSTAIFVVVRLFAIGNDSLADSLVKSEAIVALDTSHMVSTKLSAVGDVFHAFALVENKSTFAGLALTLLVVGKAVGIAFHALTVVENPSVLTVCTSLPVIFSAVGNHTTFLLRIVFERRRTTQAGLPVVRGTTNKLAFSIFLSEGSPTGTFSLVII